MDMTTEKLNEKLTDKEKQILKAIINYIDKNEISPTVREIADITQIKSTSTVQGHLEKLKNKGYIGRRETMPRTIRVLRCVE
jgi:SOS-response transcriptional repressor LexA